MIKAVVNKLKNKNVFLICLTMILLIGGSINKQCAYAAIKSNLSIQLTTTSTTKREKEYVKTFLSKANSRKESILASTTMIKKSTEYIAGKTYTGNAYYVSVNGNDLNDGLSIETAWATLNKVNEADLKEGDAVFFQRGGIWREALSCKKGITYSAYGEGGKPRIYGSPESGLGSDKWNLFYKGANGEKVWKYYKDMPDCGLIVFNDGDVWANKIFSWWNGNKYVLQNNHKKSFNVVEGLAKDLSFFSMIDLTGYKAPINKYDINTKGGLYLRCDKGNPGELYTQIEFQTSEVEGYAPQVGYDSKSVIDNLCMKYFAHGGIAPRGEDLLYSGDGALIQNCEVAWGGGCTHYYGKKGQVYFSGEAINFEVSYGTVTNNYLHDCYDGGVVIELPENKALNRTFEHNLIAKNLVERCGSGVIITDSWMDYAKSKNKYVFSDIVVKDNYFTYTGYGWSYNNEMSFYGNGDQKAVSINFWSCENRNKGIYIKNNVCYLSRDILLESMLNDKNPPKFSNNTYIQNKDGAFALWKYESIQMNKGEKNILKTIGDASGKLISLK